MAKSVGRVVSKLGLGLLGQVTANRLVLFSVYDFYSISRDNLIWPSAYVI